MTSLFIKGEALFWRSITIFSLELFYQRSRRWFNIKIKSLTLFSRSHQNLFTLSKLFILVALFNNFLPHPFKKLTVRLLKIKIVFSIRFTFIAINLNLGHFIKTPSKNRTTTLSKNQEKLNPKPHPQKKNQKQNYSNTPTPLK